MRNFRRAIKITNQKPIKQGDPPSHTQKTTSLHFPTKRTTQSSLGDKKTHVFYPLIDIQQHAKDLSPSLKKQRTHVPL
jgi:hypothetical protein